LQGLLVFQLSYLLSVLVLGEVVMSFLRPSFLVVAVILAAIGALAPWPYKERFTAGAIAFLAAAFLSPAV
jgi:hypothetical protein